MTLSDQREQNQVADELLRKATSLHDLFYLVEQDLITSDQFHEYRKRIAKKEFNWVERFGRLLAG